MISPLNREAKSTASYLQPLVNQFSAFPFFQWYRLTLDLPVPVAPTTATRGPMMVEGRR